MSDTMPLLKLVEVGGVLVAGVAFAWWQFRDLRRAREETRPPDHPASSHGDAAHNPATPGDKPAAETPRETR